MAMQEVKCPQVVKHGKTNTGFQRYYCNNKDCSMKSFQQGHKYTGCQEGIDETIIDMAANASGILDTSRVLKITTYKVMNVLKNEKPTQQRKYGLHR